MIIVTRNDGSVAAVFSMTVEDEPGFQELLQELADSDVNVIVHDEADTVGVQL